MDSSDPGRSYLTLGIVFIGASVFLMLAGLSVFWYFTAALGLVFVVMGLRDRDR